MQFLTGETMGTTWSAKFLGTSQTATALQQVIRTELDRVSEQMSSWEWDSDISRFNRTEPGTWFAVPAEFWTVIVTGLRIAQESSGAYDPTVGSLVDLWGFGPAARRTILPSRREVSELQSGSGWQNLQLDHSSRRLRRMTPCRLDFNGIAKGYAVDLLMTALRKQGVRDALVEIGGELSGAGLKPDGTPWWIDVDRPTPFPGSQLPSLRVALHELSIATSGCERHFIDAGRTFSHSINPQTGMPIDNGMIAATVIHSSCMEADAYATAFMVMGPTATLDLANRYEIAAMLLVAIGEDVTEILTPAMEAMLC